MSKISDNINRLKKLIEDKAEKERLDMYDPSKRDELIKKQEEAAKKPNLSDVLKKLKR